MSLTRVVCPSCQAALKSAAGFKPGQKLRCPKCQGVVVVPQPAAEVIEDEEEAPVPARSKPASTKRKPAAEVVDDEDEGEDRPARSKKKKKKKAGYKNSPLRFVVLGVLVIVLGVLGYMLVQKRKTDNETTEQNKRTLEKNALIEKDNEEGVEPTRPPRTAGPKGSGNAASKNNPRFVTPDARPNQIAQLTQLGQKMLGSWETSRNDLKRAFDVTFREDGTYTLTLPTGSEFKFRPHDGKWMVGLADDMARTFVVMDTPEKGQLIGPVRFQNDTLIIRDVLIDMPLTRKAKEPATAPAP